MRMVGLGRAGWGLYYGAMKKFLKIAAVLLVVLVIGIVGLAWLAFSQINSIAKLAIEQGGTRATGVATKVDSVDISFSSRTFGMKGLTIANPAGYKGTQFFAMGDTKLGFDPAKISEQLIEIPMLSLSDVNISLEKIGDKANYQVIIDNISKLSNGKGSQPAPTSPSGQPEMKFVINELTIKNVKVHAELVGSGGAVGDVLNKASSVDVVIPEIKLANVGKTGSGVGGTGVTGSELTGIILQAVMSAAANAGGGLLPEGMIGDLKGSLGKLGDLSKLADVKSLGEAASKAVDGVKEGVKGAVDSGKKAIDDAAKGLGGLIPGKKDEPKK